MEGVPAKALARRQAVAAASGQSDLRLYKSRTMADERRSHKRAERMLCAFRGFIAPRWRSPSFSDTTRGGIVPASRVAQLSRTASADRERGA